MRLSIVAAACTLAWTHLVIAGPAPARPDDAKLTSTVAELFTGAASVDGPPPAFAFTTSSPVDAPETLADARQNLDDIASTETGRTKKTKRHDNARTIAIAADGTAAWVAAELSEYSVCGMGNCDVPPDGMLHVLVLFDAATGWRPVVWHVTKTETDREYGKSLKSGHASELEPLVRNVAGAEDAAKLFEASLGDPRLLGATVADRADVVLTGSALPERAVGTAAVRAKLLAWSLAFKVRDGVRAGTTASKTVAWVAANVDATSLLHRNIAEGAYRVLAIYERTAGVWKLVQLSFSHATL